MTPTAPTRVMIGYDGSPAASAAIDVGIALLPNAHAWITHLWTPPFASEAMRRRLWKHGASVNDFVAAVDREGAAEAHRLTSMGVTLARAAGWVAEPVVERSYGGEGFQLAELAEKFEPDLVLVGSRGLGGATAVLGSVSDMVVHYAPRPVLVVPYPMLTTERADLAGGPVIVGWDGSPGATTALEAAERLFAGRRIIMVSVNDGAAGPPAPSGHELVESSLDGLHVPLGRSVAGALHAEAGRHQAAVVVVGSRGRAVVPEIVLGSVAMATVHHTFRPVVVVPHTLR